jgi:hypothetical protein
MQSLLPNCRRGIAILINTKALKAALASAGIRIDLHLIRSPGDLFDAYFWPPNHNVPHQRLYVRAGSVPTERAAEARHQMEAIVFPSLVEWLADILAQDRNSPVWCEQQMIDLNRT